jgi:hypothetical protein
MFIRCFVCLIERACRDGTRSGCLVNCGHRLACLAWPLFRLAELRPGVEVGPMTGDTMVKICRRRRRFSAQGLVGFADQLRSGRPSAITPRQRAQIVGR